MYRRILVLFLIVSCVLSRSIYYGNSNPINAVGPNHGNRFRPRPQQPQYNPSTLIIYYDGEIGKEPLLKAVEDYNAQVIYDYNNFSSISIKIPSDKTLDEAINYFNKVNGVLMVNKDSIAQLDSNVQLN